MNNSPESTSRVRLIVHGGAWAIPDNQVEAHVCGVRTAVFAVMDRLQSGEITALDAVEQAVRVLEDDPTFDAGRGSFLNANGQVEMDASIMTGDLACGAVACISNIAHPITAARLVMERSKHVLLVGQGASDFVRQFPDKVPFVDTQDLLTQEQKDLLEVLKKEKNYSGREIFVNENDVGGALQRNQNMEELRKIELAGVKKGTVGAVAIDVNGDLAAATSTGGIPLKLPGRVGDSPIIGAGTYCDKELGGASCTGWGEAIIKVSLARVVCDGMCADKPPTEVIRDKLDMMDRRANGHGGVVAIRPDGTYGFAHSTPRMAFAYFDPLTLEVVSGIESPKPHNT
eukprot:ANDGO_01103.mRNA.1 Putative L-asparaginase